MAVVESKVALPDTELHSATRQATADAALEQLAPGQVVVDLHGRAIP